MGIVICGRTGFDPTKQVNSWRTAWRALTKKAGRPASGFTIDAITALRPLRRAGQQRHSHVRMAAKRTTMGNFAGSSKIAGCNTTHDTSGLPVTARPI